MSDVPTRPSAPQSHQPAPSGSEPRDPSIPALGTLETSYAEPVTRPAAWDGERPAAFLAPVPNRRRRTIGALPVWVVAALGLVVVVAGLLAATPVIPWSRAPVRSPLADPERGTGVIGNQTAGTVSAAGPGASVEATLGHVSGGPSERPNATDGPGVTTSAPVATSSTSVPVATSSQSSHGPEIAFFSATPLPGIVLGYRVTVEITNRDALPGVWHNVAVQVNGGLPLSLNVDEPAGKVRAFAESGRACLAPVDSDAGRLEPGQTLTIVFRITAVLANSPGPARLNESTGCLVAES